ncbi:MULTISPECIES: Nif11-like leader peptide family natural product precursor [unclassified Synechococcus]|uniref:Nif11-like leader peptide family natural product precursor n=1 Tax=unclassified Synechococcus TaxID=2626047 RepID=UPI0009415374|nr:MULTISPECIES: Nif11-like leader peptide family natural product precursor [unclassified Synechococcus]
MSEEQLKAFLAKAKDDQSIQAKLKSAKSPEEVVGIAKEHGHEFTADKITQLSEGELEGVAGGFRGYEMKEIIRGYGDDEGELEGVEL